MPEAYREIIRFAFSSTAGFPVDAGIVGIFTGMQPAKAAWGYRPYLHDSLRSPSPGSSIGLDLCGKSE